jgi:membrane protease YdiL (CAAX protease family)
VRASGRSAPGIAARKFTDATWGDLAKCFVTAGLIGILSAIDISANTTTAHPFGSPFDAPATRDVFVSLGAYLVAVFVSKEVWFRGAFDSDVHHQGERHGILSAIFVSLLWSWWHLPLTVGTLVVEAASSCPSSWSRWGSSCRSSGDGPGTWLSRDSDAFSDAVRNILIGVP